MNKPHKHAELIKAWADGAEIEYKDGIKWYYIINPSWIEDMEYRIKKNIVKTVGYRRYYWKGPEGVRCAIWNSTNSYPPEEVMELSNFVKWKDLEIQYDEVEV